MLSSRTANFKDYKKGFLETLIIRTVDNGSRTYVEFVTTGC